MQVIVNYEPISTYPQIDRNVGASKTINFIKNVIIGDIDNVTK